MGGGEGGGSGDSAASEEPRRLGSGRGPGGGAAPRRNRRRAGLVAATGTAASGRWADILLLYEPERETEGAAEMERREGREERRRRARDAKGGCGRARPSGRTARGGGRGRTAPATRPEVLRTRARVFLAPSGLRPRPSSPLSRPALLLLPLFLLPSPSC